MSSSNDAADAVFISTEYWDNPVAYCREVLCVVPDNWQTNVMHQIAASQRVAVASGHGIGKVQSDECSTPTPQGMRTWGSIEVGDSLFDAHGAPTRVTDKFKHVNWPFYRITFDDGSSTLCGLEHLWSVRGRNERRNNISGWRTMTLEEIIVAGVKRPNGTAMARQWEIPIQGAVQFDEREIDLHPYLVGVWLGDGNKGESQYTKPYIEIADRIRGFGYSINCHADGKAHRIQGISHLFKSGVFLCGSHERYIPDEYKLNTIENRKELLRGLLDSDGEVNSSGSIGYSSTSERLMEDVIWLVRSLGGKSMRQPTDKQGWYPGDDGARVECRTCYRATINLPWNPFTLEHRKLAYKPSESRYQSRWIESIEFSHRGDGHCVVVDNPDHLYLTDSFIVTHNTALIAWLIHWYISTRPDPQIVVTANTKNQLDSKTWRELGKWNKQARNGHWFEQSATRFALKSSPDTWFASAIPWTEHNSESFAGTHEEHVLFLFDEASNIAQTIWDVVEGAMTTTGAKWVAFGNPTRNTGAFRECFGKFRHRWETSQIDSRTAKMVDKEQVDRWIADYGEDSDFVRIRVRGEFPRAGSNQFISSEHVDRCIEYRAEGFERMPKIMSIDVARFGDDSSVFCFRQGRKVSPLVKFKGLDTMALASRAAETIEQYQPDAVVVDGVGVGAGVVDRLIQLGYGAKLTEINGGNTPDDPIVYYNRRAEMWGLMRDALKVGIELPDDRELRDDLIGPEYGFTAKQQIQLEKKEDMKKRGLSSPDCGDALAQTYAVTVRAQESGIKPRPPPNWRA